MSKRRPPMPGTTGQRRVADLARERGYHLYRGHAFGCAPAWADGKRVQAYSLDAAGRMVLVRISLAEAETFLTTGTVPAGHVLYETGE